MESGSATFTPKKTKICVYCGSSPGNNPVYMQAARDLAKVMADNNIGLGGFSKQQRLALLTVLFF